MPTVEDEDPYAPRSSTQYYDSDSSSSSSTSSRSSSQSSASSSSGTSARSGGSSSSSSPSQAPRPRRQAAQTRSQTPAVDTVEAEEPLFGSARGGSAEERKDDTPNGSATNLDDEDERDSFYALLNVQKEATEEEIRDAYRSLAVLLHPDKHTSPELKLSAENRFRAIQRAYEVLSDTEKRSIYDHFGAQGLSQSWSLVQRSGRGGPRSAAELREEWEKVARKKKADEIENMVRGKGEYTASIDASSMFCSPDRVPRSKEVMQSIGRQIALRESETGKPFEEGEEIEISMPPVSVSERWNRVGVTALTGKHGFETPLTPYTRGIFSGQMVSRQGMGGGNLLGTLRTQWNSKLSTEFTTTLMRPRVATLKGHYEVNQFSFLTFVASSTTLAVPPQLNLSYGQRLSQKSPLTGFTALKSGSYTIGPWGAQKKSTMYQEPPSIAVGVTSHSGNGRGWTCQTSLGFDNQGVSIDYSFRPVILGSPKLSIGVNVGTRSGVSANQSLERKITENVKISFGLSFGIPNGGVRCRLGWSRLGQKVNIPINLSPKFRSDLVSFFTIVPACSLLALQHLYLQPAKRRKISTKLATLRKDNAAFIEERRLAASEALEVLREAAQKKARLERRRDGLIILQAFYGQRDTWPTLSELSPDDLYERAWGSSSSMSTQQQMSATDGAGVESARDEEVMWCDVTVAVMILISKGQLIIPGGRHKSKILGFYDPCMGERKHLIVRYLFRNRLHEVVVDDVTQLAAPLRAHQL